MAEMDDRKKLDEIKTQLSNLNQEVRRQVASGFHAQQTVQFLVWVVNCVERMRRVVDDKVGPPKQAQVQEKPAPKKEEEVTVSVAAVPDGGPAVIPAATQAPTPPKKPFPPRSIPQKRTPIPKPFPGPRGNDR